MFGRRSGRRLQAAAEEKRTSIHLCASLLPISQPAVPGKETIHTQKSSQYLISQRITCQCARRRLASHSRRELDQTNFETTIRNLFKYIYRQSEIAFNFRSIQSKHTKRRERRRRKIQRKTRIFQWILRKHFTIPLQYSASVYHSVLTQLFIRNFPKIAQFEPNASRKII